MFIKPIQQTTESSWEVYKRLEDLPADLPQPRSSALTWGTQHLWRKLQDLLADELVYEQKVELLERCWFRDYSPRQKSVTLRQLWELMN